MKDPQQQCTERTVKYFWLDGCVYEGDLGSEQRTGRGKIYWRSGSSYEGEVMGGHLHGVGTYTGADGTAYKGNWIFNKKHGFGRKRYANGDVYEGSWKWDVPEGKGRYFWNNGSEYSGDWKGGMMCGRGVLSWASGDRYDGKWLNGLANGHGVYTWADGGIYVGTWRRGLKHGGGRFYPPGSKCVDMKKLVHVHADNRVQHVSGDELNACQFSPRQRVYVISDDVPQVLRKLRHRSSADNITLSMLSSTFDDGQENRIFLEKLWSSAKGLSSVHDVNHLSKFDGHILKNSGKSLGKNQDLSKIPARESKHGNIALISEFDKETPASSSSKLLRRRQRWLMKERKRAGDTIYKGHRSYDLMLNLQLGIRYSVGKITPEQNRTLSSEDFGPKARIRVHFPREGSQMTPPHQSVDFKWKDYCPMVFRHLREMFKIDAADYMLSICGNDGLRELSSPGKSGSVFYLSQDERFMIKTLRKAEVKVLLGFLQNYYNHVRTYENTLVTKFFGLHRVKPAGGQKVRFIVMGNVVSTDSCIHKKFDLKGSSQGRSTEKVETDENTTLKDLDLDFVFHLKPSLQNAVLEQISTDCKFLESERIMDYSLLLGLHFKAPQISSHVSLERVPIMEFPFHEAVVSKLLANKEDMNSKCFASLSEELQQDVSASGRLNLLKLASAGDAQFRRLVPATDRHSVRLGVNMPAKACRRVLTGTDDSHFREVYDVVLYFGIIDILQEYDISKKLEHAYKSIQFDSLSISAVDPAMYANRFQHFMHQIFPANP